MMKDTRIIKDDARLEVMRDIVTCMHTINSIYNEIRHDEPDKKDIYKAKYIGMQVNPVTEALQKHMSFIKGLDKDESKDELNFVITSFMHRYIEIGEYLVRNDVAYMSKVGD